MSEPGPASWHYVRYAFETPDLSAAEKAVLVALAFHVNQETAATTVGHVRLAELTSLGRSTVGVALRGLESRGLIHRRRRMNGNRRTSDLITLLGLSVGPSPIGTGAEHSTPERSAGKQEPTTSLTQEERAVGSRAAPERSGRVRSRERPSRVTVPDFGRSA